MTVVYQVRPDVDRYQGFLLADERLVLAEALRFRGAPVADWSPPKVTTTDPLLARGDFWGYNANSSSIVVSPRTLGFDSARALLEAAGQLLLLPFEGSTYSVLNVTALVDALDEEKTEWVLGQTSKLPIRIKKYAFLPERLPQSSLFKIEKSIYIFCSETARNGQGFKETVEQLKLTGLIFTEVRRG